MTSQAHARGDGSRAHIERVAGLLRAYPNLSDAELRAVADFLRHAPILDQGALSSQSGMTEAIARFRREQRRFFAWSVKELTVLAVVLVAFAATIVLLWDIAA